MMLEASYTVCGPKLCLQLGTYFAQLSCDDTVTIELFANSECDGSPFGFAPNGNGTCSVTGSGSFEAFKSYCG